MAERMGSKPPAPAASTARGSCNSHTFEDTESDALRSILTEQSIIVAYEPEQALHALVKLLAEDVQTA